MNTEYIPNPSSIPCNRSFVETPKTGITNFCFTNLSNTPEKCLNDNFFDNIISVGHSQVWRILKSIPGGACTLRFARLGFSTTVSMKYTVSLRSGVGISSDRFATPAVARQSGGVVMARSNRERAVPFECFVYKVRPPI